MNYDVVDTLISPEGRLEVLSKAEVAKLLDTSQGGLYQVFRKCALAVLNSGSSIDDGKELLERYKDFDTKIIQRERGIKLDIRGAPAHAAASRPFQDFRRRSVSEKSGVLLRPARCPCYRRGSSATRQYRSPGRGYGRCEA